MNFSLQRRPFLLSLVLLLILTGCFFSDVLFRSGDSVLSARGTDLSGQFVYWRDFGFSQIREGNFPLWNPHVFCGIPFFGGFQSALLYPPNYLHLILPLNKAINFGIALHVFLGGVFTYLWVAHRSLHPAACFLSAVLFMFSGPFFCHIFPGHLSNLSTMVWAPLVFLAIDGWVDTRLPGWCLLGMFAVLMQILAGHPQYLLYTAVAAGVYSVLRIVRARKRIPLALGCVGIYVGAALLGSVQLLTGIQAAGESVRNTGLSFEAASMFSFPPENLVTLLTPGFFGDMTRLPYWGRCYLWEMSLYVSVTGLVLALYGALYGDRSKRRFSLFMVAVLLLLAFGRHTPLFKVLYRWVPFFDKFRGNSKFIFPASLFLIVLAGVGLDRLLRTATVPRKFVVAILLLGASLAVLAFAVWGSANEGKSGIWSRVMLILGCTGESYMDPSRYEDSLFVQKAGLFAAKGLLVSAGVVLGTSIPFQLRMTTDKLVYALIGLAFVELLLFAKAMRPVFRLTDVTQDAALSSIVSQRSNERLYNTRNQNIAMSLGCYDIWGFDPGVLRRYAEFMSFTQNVNPDHASQYLGVSTYHRLFRMLRCAWIVGPGNEGVSALRVKGPLPRLLLLTEYSVVGERDEVLEQMAEPEFDPRKTVILETEPYPKPVEGGDEGVVTLLDQSTDHLSIEAEVPAPAILMITDAFSDGWGATALPGSTQQEYEVMPANYVLRAIPLTKGHHRIRVEYLPFAFRLGRSISIVSLVLYVSALTWIWRGRNVLSLSVRGRVDQKGKAGVGDD